MKTKAVTLHALSTVLKWSKNSLSPKVIQQNICLTQAKNMFKARVIPVLKVTWESGVYEQHCRISRDISDTLDIFLLDFFH